MHLICEIQTERQSNNTQFHTESKIRILISIQNNFNQNNFKTKLNTFTTDKRICRDLKNISF